MTPRGVAVLGATGYAGSELVRLLAAHPGASLKVLTSRQHAGEPFDRIWPGIGGPDLTLEAEGVEAVWLVSRGVDTVFSALPHGALAGRVTSFLDAGLQVIDLSADFRLETAADYATRYHEAHPEPDLLGRAVYGLTEWCNGELPGARLLANPGCYATAILLGLLPAVRAGLWDGGTIVANALSGVSGAGRTPSLTTHFVECGEGAAPYRVGEEHAHLGEIARALRKAGGEGPIVFNPHLVPMSRGIVASLALPLGSELGAAEALSLYRDRYAGCPFVRVLDPPRLPETRHVRGSNRCDLAVRTAAGGRTLLVYTALDNLQKGAAGQAVQNWNRMQRWPEETGLSTSAWGCA